MATAHKVILVTGASRGIGASVAHLLTAITPPTTVVTVSRSPVAEEAPNAHHIQLSLSNPDGPMTAIKTAIDKYGRLDGLVINHAVLDPVERICEGSGDIGVELDGWRKGFEVNFFSAVGLLQSSIPHLRKTKGRVIFVSSGAAITGYPAWGAYSAAKAALNSLCRTLATEEPEITAVAIRPGVVDTDMQKEIRERHAGAMGEEHKRFVDFHEQGKLVQPELPGKVIAGLVVAAGKGLSGGFYSWDAEELKEFQ